MVVIRPVVTRKEISQTLQNRRIKHPWGSFHPYWTSPTIGALKEVARRSPEKYAAYMSLINEFMNIAGNSAGVGMEYTLHVPSAQALLAIHLEELQEIPKANEDILQRCYRPDRGVIDLRELVYIERNYVKQLQRLLAQKEKQ